MGLRAVVLLASVAFMVMGSSASAGPTSHAAEKNCSDFSTQPQAQQYFESHGGSPSNDVDGLDRDHDGIACEDLPGGGNTSPPPSTPPTTVRARCRRGPHPDTKCTPGRAFAGATAKQVCTPGYS